MQDINSDGILGEKSLGTIGLNSLARPVTDGCIRPGLGCANFKRKLLAKGIWAEYLCSQPYFRVCLSVVFTLEEHGDLLHRV